MLALYKIDRYIYIYTDLGRLDGLNKTLRDWDLRYYHHCLRNACADIQMNPLLYPAREYICQVARFDPSKGIPDVIESYRKLRARLAEELPHANPPQLLMYFPPPPLSPSSTY